MSVKLKVIETGDIKIMSDSAAQRLIQINPKAYAIVPPPRVDVLNLPPLQSVNTEKKSVVVAVSEQTPNELTEPEKRKPGRPKVNP